MPTTTRPRTLPQLLVTTMAAVVTATLYLYLTRPQAPRLPSRLVADRLAAPICVEFNKAPLAEVFQTLSQQIGVNIAVDWKTLAGPGLAPDTSVTFAHAAASAADVLDAFLQEHPLQGNIVWAERDGQIVISDDATANAPVVRLYDIAPLIKERLAFSPVPADSHPYPQGVGLFQTSAADSAHPVGEIMSFLQYAVDMDSWIDNGGRIGQMTHAMNHLVVSQTPANHAKIQRILIALGLRGETCVAQSEQQGSPP